MKFKHYILLSLSILGIGALKAQRLTKEIALPAVLEQALQNNNTVKMAQFDEAISGLQHRESDAAFLPQITLSYTSSLTNNPLMVFGNKLMQANVVQQDFDPAGLNNPSDYQNHNAMVNVVQPILNADMLFQRRAANIQKEIYSHKTSRTKEYITFDVEKTYNQLALTYQVVEVLKEAVETAKSANEKVLNFYNQGLVKKSDYLNAQVYQSTLETQLATEQSNIELLSDQLSVLMGETPGTTYTVAKSYQEELVAEEAKVFNENRSDFLAYKKSIEAYGKMTNANRTSMLPKLNAFGNYQYNSKTFGFGANSYFVGLQLSWDIFNGSGSIHKTNTQKYLKQKAEVELAKEQDQAKLEIDKTNRSLNVLKSRITQLNTSLEQAKESLKLTRDRYDAGLLSTTDLLMVLTQLSQQKMLLSQAYFEYHVSQSYLTFLTSSSI